MKEKIITIKPKGITQKQWINFLLELNLMKKAWKPYGVDVEIKAPDKYQNKIDEVANLWEKTKDPKYKDLWYKYIKEWCNGPHYINRRDVSSSRSDKRNDD